MIKFGDIVTFKNLWEGVVKTINSNVVKIEGNSGIFLLESFEKKDEFNSTDLKRIWRKFNWRSESVSMQSIKRNYNLYKSDKFPFHVHRMIVDALKGCPDEIKHIYNFFLHSSETKLGHKLN